MSLENYKEYPYLIYEPYSKTLKEEDPQRKDHQRICLEMMLSLNASICLANYYHIKTRGEDKDKEQLADAVKNIFKGNEDGELKFDLGQMSIGKWNQITRDTSKVLMEATNNGKNNDFLVEQIGKLYQDSKWNGNVNELIKRRNADAHGEVKDNLDEELKKRQDMLDVLMGELKFFNDYKMIIPIDEELKDGGLIYRCKDLAGDGNGIIDITEEDMETEIDHFSTYLYDKKTQCLLVEPMIFSYNTTPESQELYTFIYSKTINKKGDLHYSNHLQSLDIIESNKSSVGKLPTPQEKCGRFKAFRIHIEDANLVKSKKPNISINRKFKTAATIINDDVFLDITIQNNGDADAQDVRTVLEYPRDIFSRFDDDGNKELTETQQKKPFEILLDELPAKKKPWKNTYKFRAKKDSQCQFQEMTLTYNYEDEFKEGKIHKHKIDEGINVVNAVPLVHQVVDPDDPQSQVPIINLQLDYRDHKKPENSGHNPKIGQEIDFIVKAKNIGKSISHDVDIHIFPPSDEMDLVSGSPSWRGNINPGEVVTRLFTLRPRKQGIFGMKMRDVLYTNSQGMLFKTLAYEDHKILVRNDPEFKYRFLLEDVWSDLTVDEDEKLRMKRNKAFTDIEQEKKDKIENDVKVRAVKNVINEVLANVSIPVKQITKQGMIGYCLDDYPFLIIDFTEINQIQLLLKGDYKNDSGLKNQGILKSKGLHDKIDPKSWQGKYNNISFYAISLEHVGSLGGASLLKRLTNQAIRYVENHEVVMISFLKDLGRELGFENLFSDIKFNYRWVEGVVREELVDNLLIRSVILFMNTKGRLNLIATRKDYAGLGPELAKPQYGFKKGYRRTAKEDKKLGLYKVVDGTTNNIHLYSELITNAESTISDLTDLIIRLVVDIANARAVLSREKDIKKPEHKHFFNQLCNYITDDVGKYHYRYEKDQDGIVFYRGEDMPLYSNSNAFLLVQEQKNYSDHRLFIKLRYMDKDAFNEILEAEDEIGFKIIHTDYWFCSLLHDEKFDSLFYNAIEQAYNSAEKALQITSYGWLQYCIREKAYPILEKILKTVYEQDGWVPYITIDDKLSSNLRKITGIVNKLELKPFLEYDHNYTSEDQKGKGRIRIADGSRNLIKSVLDDLGT